MKIGINRGLSWFATWFGIGLFVLLSCLPLPLLRALGWALAKLFYPFARERRRVAATNLRLCLPHLTEAERQRLVKQHFVAFAQSFLDRSILWCQPAWRVRRIVTLRGLEHATALGEQPFFFLGAHFVGLDAAWTRLSMEHKLIGMYVRQKNRVFDQWMRDRRDRFGTNLGLTRQDGIRPALRALKQGFHFLYFPDMDYGPHDAIFVPFFGVPAATITATSRMASAVGAAILPVTIRMTRCGYEVTILPPWPNYPSGDDAADARQLNAWIESLVPSMPEQYFWVHKRFKTRPPGDAKFY